MTRTEENAFTLIEVLLALSLAAVLASALYGLLWSSAGAWKRMRERAEMYQTARIVFERLQTDLQNEIPLYGGGLKDHFSFDGAAAHLAFPALIQVRGRERNAALRPALALVEYA